MKPEKMLLRILDHVAPGSSLVIYPLPDYGPVARILTELKAEKQIADFKNQMGLNLVIQKPK